MSNSGRLFAFVFSLVFPDQITETSYRNLIPQYVFKQATLTPIAWGRAGLFFRMVGNSSPTFSDGVLDLFDERMFTKNLMPSMNAAQLTFSRNTGLIREITKRDNPRTREVLAARLTDSRHSPELKLMYAAILAATGDHTGQQFLLARAGDRSAKNLDCAFWVLGNLQQFSAPAEEPAGEVSVVEFVELSETPSGEIDLDGVFDRLFSAPPAPTPTRVDLAWAAETMLDALKTDEEVVRRELPQHESSVKCRTLAIEHGSFAELLIYMKNEQAMDEMGSSTFFAAK